MSKQTTIISLLIVLAVLLVCIGLYRYIVPKGDITTRLTDSIPFSTIEERDLWLDIREHIVETRYARVAGLQRYQLTTEQRRQAFLMYIEDVDKEFSKTSIKRLLEIARKSYDFPR